MSKLLGHGNPAVTLTLYTHFIRKELPAALDLAAELEEAQAELEAGDRTTVGQLLSPSPTVREGERVAL